MPPVLTDHTVPRLHQQPELPKGLIFSFIWLFGGIASAAVFAFLADLYTGRIEHIPDGFIVALTILSALPAFLCMYMTIRTLNTYTRMAEASLQSQFSRLSANDLAVIGQSNLGQANSAALKLDEREKEILRQVLKDRQLPVV